MSRIVFNDTRLSNQDVIQTCRRYIDGTKIPHIHNLQICKCANGKEPMCVCHLSAQSHGWTQFLREPYLFNQYIITGICSEPVKFWIHFKTCQRNISSAISLIQITECLVEITHSGIKNRNRSVSIVRKGSASMDSGSVV